jgi:alkylhydroperoxidase family enzyme
MLAYVEKLTLRPWEVIKEDVIALRTAGFSDAAILDINQVTGYYAYVNRLADGLGVELEPIHRQGFAGTRATDRPTPESQ